MWIVIIIFIIIYIVINNLNENINNVEQSDNIIIAIYPTGTDSETYYFDINVDGKLTAIFGTRKTDNIGSKNRRESCKLISKRYSTYFKIIKRN